MFWTIVPWVGVMFVIAGIIILLGSTGLSRLLVARLGSSNESEATSGLTQATWIVRTNGLVAVLLGTTAIVEGVKIFV